jgi:hypothetical protein
LQIVQRSPAVRFIGQFSSDHDGSAGPSRHVGQLPPMSLLSTRSESKDFEPSNPFQNDRKIAVRRPRRTNLCNKAVLYHE